MSAVYVWENTTIDTIDADPYQSSFTSLAFDANGNPAISYQYRNGIYDLKYAWKDAGGWHNTTVDAEGAVGYSPSLAFNGDYPAISYQYGTERDLKYAWKDAGGWHNTTVDAAGFVGDYTSLAFNGSYPAIGYYNNTQSSLKYAWKDAGGWHNTTVDNSGWVGTYLSLAFNGSYPAISYRDGPTNNNLKYAWKDAGGWHTTTVDDAGDVGIFTSLAFDTDGNPAISYYDLTNKVLKYAWENGGVWHTITVDETGDDVGKYTSLAFDTDGNPAISYHDSSPNNNLKYAWRDEGVWQTTTVDAAGYVGQYTSLAFDTDDNPAISYFDRTNGKLKYAFRIPVGTITVTSAPTGATVWLDDVETESTTPADLTDVPTGMHNVTVLLDEYQPGINNSVEVLFDQTTVVTFSLVPVPGNLTVTSHPEEAWIWLNGVNTTEQTNTTLEGISPGTYDVTVQKQGYETPANETVTVVSNATTAISFDLIRQTGILQVNSTPSGASVYLNGTDTGALTNVTLSDRPVGTYNVTVVKDGYDSASRIVTLTKDETEDISFTLVQQVGTLQVNSNPSGAGVYLNGTDTGALTNVTLSDTPVGVYNVTVVKDGYDTATRIVTLTKDETEDISFTLIQQVGTLQVNSTPSGAGVYLNGTDTGALTNVTLSDRPVGTYNVTVVKDGYDSATRIVTLTKDETEDISFTLVQQVGTLQVNSNPSGASVYLNGTDTGAITNVTLSGKPAGVYNVTVVKDGYDSATRIVTLTKDETEDISFTLVQQVGTLQVNSNPSGAGVYLNGTDTGAITNVTLSDRPVGTYNVTVVKDGYDSATRIVTLTKGETEDISFTLIQQVGTLQVNSNPSGASIYLNGTDTGAITNVMLSDRPVGTYNVTVVKDGYDSATRIVTLTKGETEDISFTLIQQVGTLQVNSNPSGASIYLNGTDTGAITNVTLSDKPVGVYNVTVVKDGYDTAAQIVTLTKDETEDISFTLVQQVGTLQVNSTPSGASVYLNGTDTGAITNVTLSDTPVGVYNVTVEKEGYEPATRIAPVTEGTTENVAFTLTLLPPVANFTADPTAGSAPLTVQFNDTSTGIGDTWHWDFGDGTNSTEQNPSHTYATGTYTVALTVANTAGNDTVVKTDCITAVYRRTPSDGDDDNALLVFDRRTSTLLTSSAGKILRTTEITSDDDIATLTLPLGTIALGGDGNPLTNITIRKISSSDLPPATDKATFSFAGFTYECNPAGATFAPPITLTFTLSAEEWEMLNGDVSVRFYDDATGTWVNVPVTVDASAHTVTATVAHFSIFALCVEAADDTLPEAGTIPVTTVPTATEETNVGDDTDTPEPTPTQQSPLGFAPVAALGALLLLKRRR
ncbi:PEGA domain-containing protein [Methanogenium organophilum]|uniref:PEGA domain-containing protein n=1 Tax=Methanogenium organophilum TaxID=2199 RepID=A0A9X9T8J7_METOG|nr:PEGA domain-containing protein [Methanogenium organophilum]WAI01765.1 PEGA domain-containing protein [Methanogenium organophilum]